MKKITKSGVTKLTPEFFIKAADWFSDKWGIPAAAYLDSMNESVTSGSGVPSWYAVFDGDKIIAGIGVIKNDFHTRGDLTPNICAVYVEPEYRGEGIASKMLGRVCDDLQKSGIGTVYLLTDHTAFYEKCGFTYLCDVLENSGTYARVYMKNIWPPYNVTRHRTRCK